MKRNWKLVLCLLLATLLMTACSSKPDPEQFPDIPQALGPTSTPSPTAAPQVSTENTSGGTSIFDANPYDVGAQNFTEADALSEENYVDPNYGTETLYSYSQPEGTAYAYAGSTPIPLNPIDMPTPTPRPDLTFTYAEYTASTVGVKFEGPVNWQVNESQSGMMILSEPQGQIKDNQQCIITISGEPIAGSYSQSDLETHVRQRLDTIGGEQFTEWKPSYTATRYMMGSNGVYANYSGMLTDGTEVGGRIQYVCIDNVLYGLEIVFPLGFKEDFLDVFGQIRSTMSLIR